MHVDTRSMMSLTEANQNFSRVARLVDEVGSVVILRHNVPRYVVLDYAKLEDRDGDDDEVLAAGQLFLDQHRQAFVELAQ